MAHTTRPPTTTETATAPARRSLAPDLARGFMLLVIATVHAHMFRQLVTAGETLSSLDTVVTGFMTLFAESRGYPMFAALFGYGLAQIHLRRTGEGWSWPRMRSLVRRRGRWMIVIGFLHTALIFYGDIIAVYGLIALVFAGLLHRTDRHLLATGFAWASVGTLVYAAFESLFLVGATQQESVALSPLTDMLYRLASWPVMGLLMFAISILPFTVGIWAGRRRVLDHPERHLRLLRAVALVGIPATVIGALPQTLVMIQVWTPEPALHLAAKWLHVVSGYAGGFGYAALIALVVVALGDRRGPLVLALAATGQRSMTCYLLQSVALAVLLMPYTLNLAPRFDDAQMVLVGALVWAVTVLLAAVIDRFGIRGPAETFLRRMTYGPTRKAEPVRPGGTP